MLSPPLLSSSDSLEKIVSIDDERDLPISGKHTCSLSFSLLPCYLRIECYCLDSIHFVMYGVVHRIDYERKTKQKNKNEADFVLFYNTKKKEFGELRSSSVRLCRIRTHERRQGPFVCVCVCCCLLYAE